MPSPTPSQSVTGMANLGCQLDTSEKRNPPQKNTHHHLLLLLFCFLFFVFEAESHWLWLLWNPLCRPGWLWAHEIPLPLTIDARPVPLHLARRRTLIVELPCCGDGCLWGIVLTTNARWRAQSTVGGTIPKQVDQGYIRKVAGVSIGTEFHNSAFCVVVVLWWFLSVAKSSFLYEEWKLHLPVCIRTHGYRLLLRIMLV